MKARIWRNIGVAVVTALTLSAVCASDTAPSASGGIVSSNAPPTKVIPPANVNLPPQLAEVVRLSQSGVDDSVVLSYIQRAPPMAPLSADQILYLRDVGIPSNVLQALVEHGNASSITAAAPTTPPPESTESATPPANAAAAPTSGAPPPTSDAGYYYDSLAPYGTWLNVPAYGWCWQPTVVVVNPTWRPYCDAGSWYWSDYGWYWNSYYSWGWAPFHYGRWCQYPGYGWLWCPDRVWGPSWVCWRNYPGYCGWAALPPGACYTAGFGWTYNGVAVGFSFGFGLGVGCFTFVDYDHFCDGHPSHYCLRGREADDAFRRGHMNNDFAAGPDHHIVNRGVDPKQIETATHTPVRQVAVRDMPRDGGRGLTPGRLERTGNSTVVYRPGPQTPAPKNPALANLRSVPTYNTTQYRAASSRPAVDHSEVPRGASLLTPSGQRSVPSGTASRTPVARPAAPTAAGRNAAPANSGVSPGASSHSERPSAAPATGKPQAMYQPRPTASAWTRSTPAYTWNRSSTPAVAPQSRYYSTPSVPRSAPAPAYRPSYSGMSRSSWSAPSVASRAPSYSGRSYSAPSYSGRSFSAPSYGGRSAPSSGGGGHSGGVSSGGGSHGGGSHSGGGGGSSSGGRSR